MKEHAFFFELIDVMVSHRQSLSSPPSPEEWEAIFSQVRNQTLIGVLFAAVQKLPPEQRPPKKVLFPWFMISEKIKQKNRQMNRATANLMERFAAEGFRSAVLKGQGVALYYPEPLLRMSGDIDLWMEGGMKRVMKFLRERFKVGIVYYHHAEADILPDVDVEVHYRPSFFMNPFRNRRLQRWFFEQMPEQLEHLVSFSPQLLFEPGEEGADEARERCIAVPTRDFNAVFLLHHIFRHFVTEEGIGFRQLADYYYCLLAPGDNQAVRRNLERLHLSSFAASVMYILQKVFHLDEAKLLVPADPKKGEFLLQEILLAGNFGKTDARRAKQCCGNKIETTLEHLKRDVRFGRFYFEETIFDVPFRFWIYLHRRLRWERPSWPK